MEYGDAQIAAPDDVGVPASHLNFPTGMSPAVPHW